MTFTEEWRRLACSTIWSVWPKPLGTPNCYIGPPDSTRWNMPARWGLWIRHLGLRFGVVLR